MYVAMPYFVFLEAMVSWLFSGENIPHVWNPFSLLCFTVSWARVRLVHVCPSFVRNPMMPLCFISFSLCVTIHLIIPMDVIVSCMIIREPISLLKQLYRECVGMASYVHNGPHSLSVHGL